MSKLSRFVRTTLTLAVAMAASPLVADTSRELTLAQRVEYQRRIEYIRWSHRSDSAVGPHPSFDVSVPAELIREKVDNYLLQGAALDRFWRRPLTGEQLQAEMERMAKETQSPDRLRELFAALDDDPYVIAECLARPLLAERLTRNAYAYDNRFHDSLRAQAEAALAEARGSIEALRNAGYTYAETVWELDEGSTASGEGLRLSPAEWDDVVKRLAQGFPVATAASRTGGPHVAVLPVGELGSLREDAEHLFVQAVLEQSGARLRVGTFSWSKVGFNDWWTAMRDDLHAYPTAVMIDAPDGGYRSVAISTGSCALDTWATTHFESVPPPNFSHTAVWTGTEMIVWGGRWFFNLTNTGARYDPATDTWQPTSTVGAPGPRELHTAIWTGTEMIVWGGLHIDPEDPLDDGGRYNPATDSWTPTSWGVEGRYEHTANWTGTEMIVFGGKNWSALPQNTGRRYDPIANTWISIANAPFAFALHTAVWTGTEMIVWGGQNFLNPGARYDPVANQWSATSTEANVPSPRSDHTAVWTGTEMIVWGGFPPALNTGGRYNPATDSWLPTSIAAGVPSGRRDHTAVWTGTEMIVWGGYNAASAFATGGRYDPATDSWTATSTAGGTPAGRRLHTAVWTGTEMIVWGGAGSTIFDSGGRYDPTTDSWIATSTMPSARWGHTAIWTGNEMIVWGGSGGAYLSSGGRYDLATDSWVATSTGANLPAGRNQHTAVWTGNEMIVWGGDGGAYLNSGGRYDPVADSWTATSTGANVPAGRESHTAMWTGTEMIVWGGAAGGAGAFNTGGRYDPTTNAWIATDTGASVPSARKSHTAVWTGTEMIVWGGHNGSSVYNTGGRYHPDTNSWTPTSTTTVPAGRYVHTAVWAGAEMIVWGGFNGSSSYYNTGGRYRPDTNSWTPTSTSVNVPSARSLHTAVWTGVEMIVWGGYSGSTTGLGTGGRYRPGIDSWLATSTGAAVPAPRFRHSAVWTGAEMIVWGGVSAGVPLSTGGRYCACAASAPMGVPHLVAHKVGSSVSLEWTLAPTATDYDVVKGDLEVLRGTAGDYSAATSACLANNVPAGPVGDLQVPPAGEAIWYLIRPENCGGVGSFDSGGAGQVASRDTGISHSGGACH